jgi:hypothetical protein
LGQKGGLLGEGGHFKPDGADVRAEKTAFKKNPRAQKTKTRINKSSGGKSRARKNSMGKRT